MRLPIDPVCLRADRVCMAFQEEKTPAVRDDKVHLHLDKLHMNAAEDPELIRKAYEVCDGWSLDPSNVPVDYAYGERYHEDSYSMLTAEGLIQGDIVAESIYQPHF